MQRLSTSILSIDSFGSFEPRKTFLRQLIQHNDAQKKKTNQKRKLLIIMHQSHINFELLRNKIFNEPVVQTNVQSIDANGSSKRKWWARSRKKNTSKLLGSFLLCISSLLSSKKRLSGSSSINRSVGMRGANELKSIVRLDVNHAACWPLPHRDSHIHIVIFILMMLSRNSFNGFWINFWETGKPINNIKNGTIDRFMFICSSDKKFILNTICIGILIFVCVHDWRMFHALRID